MNFMDGELVSVSLEGQKSFIRNGSLQRADDISEQKMTCVIVSDHGLANGVESVEVVPVGPDIPEAKCNSTMLRLTDPLLGELITAECGLVMKVSISSITKLNRSISQSSIKLINDRVSQFLDGS